MKPNTPICPIKRPTLDAGAGIEPMELASLAAVMSSPAERPKVTAERAMALFQECKIEIWRVAAELRDVRQSEAELNGKSKRDSNFIASLESCNGDPSGAVTLDSFLIACGTGTKIGARIAKWRGFARFYVEMRGIIDGTQDRWGSCDPELKAAGDEMASFYEVNGIPRDQVFSTRDIFSTWLMENKGRDVEAKAEKSKRAKINLPVCRKAVNKGKMTENDEHVLKEMTGDEVEAAIQKLRKDNELGENGEGSIRAAITDANRTKSAKPRVAKKSPKA
jgi:hypothetical protein